MVGVNFAANSRAHEDVKEALLNRPPGMWLRLRSPVCGSYVATQMQSFMPDDQSDSVPVANVGLGARSPPLIMGTYVPLGGSPLAILDGGLVGFE